MTQKRLSGRSDARLSKLTIEVPSEKTFELPVTASHKVSAVLEMITKQSGIAVDRQVLYVAGEKRELDGSKSLRRNGIREDTTFRIAYPESMCKNVLSYDTRRRGMKEYPLDLLDLICKYIHDY